MNLMKFKGADDAVKLTIRLSAGYCIILTIAFASSIIFLINKNRKKHTARLSSSTGREKSMRQAACLPAICGNTNT